MPYTYKLHWLGAQHYFQNVDAPKKLIFTGPAHLERPFHQYHDEIIRWYDHWLKGQNTGIMDEPPVRYWLNGGQRVANRNGLAPARDEMDEVLSVRLGDAVD